MYEAQAILNLQRLRSYEAGMEGFVRGPSAIVTSFAVVLFIPSRYNLDLASFITVHWRLRLTMNGDEECR